MINHSIRADRALLASDLPTARVRIPRTTPPHTAHSKASTGAPWCQRVSSTPRRLSQRMLASASDVSEFTSTPDAARNTSMEGAIRSFFDAFNQRDLEQMADAVAEDVEHCNLAYEKPYPKGKQAVVQFYESFVKAVPRSATFVIEDTTGTNSSSGTIGVIWHLQIQGTVIPNSSGVSFFRLNSSNRICYVRESPEHFTKITGVALPALSMLSPLLSLVEPLLRGNNGSNSPPTSSQPNQAASRASASTQENIQASGDDATRVPRTRRRANVAMRPLSTTSETPSATTESDEDSAQVPAPVVDMKAEVEVPVHASRVPALSGSTGAQPRLHNGYTATSQRVARNVAADAAVPGAPAATVAAGAPTPRFAGVWQKDRSRCDRSGYERALDLMGIGGIQKATALGLEGMEVQLDEDAGVFETFFLTPVPFFKVRERFLLGGVETKQSRRDLRGGEQAAKAWLRGDRVFTEIAWGPQEAGTGKEEYWMDENGQLNVKSIVTVKGQSSTTVQVYTRQDEGDMDSRYYAPKRDIPFGIDPNQLSEGILGNFLK